MKVQSHLSNARMSPRKIRQLAQVVVNQPVSAAVSQLTFQSGKAAPILLKLLQSAIANAKNNHELMADNLKVTSIIIGDGTKFHRFQPVSRGSAHPFVKRNSHITIVLEEITPQAKKTKKKKTDIQTLSVEELEVPSEIPEEKVVDITEEAKPTDLNQVDHLDAKADVQQKIRMMQKGGDKKKSHRRKSF